MHTVYVLQSESTHRFYIGSTSNIATRLSEHNRGQTKSTRGRGPWLLRWTKEFNTRRDAVKFELHLKSLKSHRAIEEMTAAERPD